MPSSTPGESGKRCWQRHRRAQAQTPGTRVRIADRRHRAARPTASRSCCARPARHARGTARVRQLADAVGDIADVHVAEAARVRAARDQHKQRRVGARRVRACDTAARTRSGAMADPDRCRPAPAATRGSSPTWSLTPGTTTVTASTQKPSRRASRSARIGASATPPTAR